MDRSRVGDISNNGLERKLMRTKFQPHIFFGAQVSPYSFTNLLVIKVLSDRFHKQRTIIISFFRFIRLNKVD